MKNKRNQSEHRPPAQALRILAETQPAGGEVSAWLVKHLPQICAGITTGIALLALIGWQVNLRFLAGQWGNYIPMAPSSALAFLLLGAALFAFACWPVQRSSRIFTFTSVSIIFLFSLLVLTKFITGIDLGLEQALSRTNELSGSIPVGRMSPLTAVSFVLESVAILFLLSAPRWRHSATAAALLTTGAIAIIFTILAGYALSAPLLYGGSTVPTAFPTASARPGDLNDYDTFRLT